MTEHEIEVAVEYLPPPSAWLAWWRRRHARPFDWAEESPELIPPGGHLRRVSAYPPKESRPGARRESETATS